MREEMITYTTDKERIDFLQELNDKKAYTGRCILRNSMTGRGWRLHESSKLGYASVRDAVDDFMNGYLEYYGRK